jgi:diaminopimelate epimerase
MPDFVQKTGADSIRIRTFERGVEGKTLSRSTGATVCAAIIHHLGLMGDTVKIGTKGGPQVIYLKTGAQMEDPAETVFSGVLRF